MRKIIVPVLAALALVGCGGIAPEAERNETVINSDAEVNMTGNGAAAENITARVLAMGNGERNGVFARALMDAELPCDGVISSERMADQDGQPLWRAKCRPPGGSHLIQITADGTANIVSRTDR